MKSSSHEAADPARREAHGARAASATRLSSEPGSQPATEHTLDTSGASSETLIPRTTNITGGPTRSTSATSAK